MSTLLQAARQVAAAGRDYSHILEGLGLGIAYGVGKLLDHRKGKSRDHNRDGWFTRIENGLHAVQRDIGTVEKEVRDLKAHVIGPDGENGIRGDVRELKTEVRDILVRERQAGMYDRRVAPLGIVGKEQNG